MDSPMMRDLAQRLVDQVLDDSGANARHSAGTPRAPEAVAAYNQTYEERRLQYVGRMIAAIAHATETVESAIRAEVA